MVVTFHTTMVMAANDTGIDLTSTLNNTAVNNNTPQNNTNVNRTNNTNNSNNSSIYNNTNLPHTGIEDSIPIAVLVVIFGISAVYAYKKISEYKNI